MSSFEESTRTPRRVFSTNAAQGFVDGARVGGPRERVLAALEIVCPASAAFMCSSMLPMPSFQNALSHAGVGRSSFATRGAPYQVTICAVFSFSAMRERKIVDAYFGGQRRVFTRGLNAVLVQINPAVAIDVGRGVRRGFCIDENAEIWCGGKMRCCKRERKENEDF